MREGTATVVRSDCTCPKARVRIARDDKIYERAADGRL
jgi:hypothetical protein